MQESSFTHSMRAGLIPKLSLISAKPGSVSVSLEGLRIGDVVTSIQNQSPVPAQFKVNGEPYLTIEPGALEQFDLYIRPIVFTSLDVSLNVPLTPMPKADCIALCRERLPRDLAPPAAGEYTNLADIKTWRQRAIDFIAETGAVLEEGKLPADYESRWSHRTGDWFNHPPAILKPFEDEEDGSPAPAVVYIPDRHDTDYIATTKEFVQIDCPDGHWGCNVYHSAPVYSVTVAQAAERKRINAAPRVGFADLLARWQAKYAAWMQEDIQAWIERVFLGMPGICYYPKFNADEYTCELVSKMYNQEMYDAAFAEYNLGKETWRDFFSIDGVLFPRRSSAA